MPARKIEIILDQSPSSPRENDNVGVMEFTPVRGFRFGDARIAGSVKERLRELPKGTLALPVYFQDGNDVEFRATPFWHAQEPVGLIYATPAQMTINYGDNGRKSRSLARSVMLAELDEYQKYVNGECFGLNVIDESGESECIFGYLGSDVFENGMASNTAEEDLPLLLEAAKESPYVYGTDAQLATELASRVAQRASMARASARPRRR